MPNGNDRTPTPAPISLGSIPGMEHQRTITGAIAISAPPPPPPPHINELWKQIVAICLGLAAVGTVAYVIGKQFFVTRDEWVQIRDNVIQTSNQLQLMNANINELKVLKEDLSRLNIRLIEMDVQRKTPLRR